MSEETISSTYRECPYCGYEYQPEGEDFHEDEKAEQCDGCGKKFLSFDSVSIDYCAKPDCELNNEEHDYQPHKAITNAVFCSKCDDCKLVEQPQNEAQSHRG